MIENNLLVDIVLVVVVVGLSLDKIIRNILLVRSPRPQWGKFTWLGPPKKRGLWYRPARLCDNCRGHSTKPCLKCKHRGSPFIGTKRLVNEYIRSVSDD